MNYIKKPMEIEKRSFEIITEHFYSFECEGCGETIFVDEEDFDENEIAEVVCPHCGLEFIVSDSDEERLGEEDEDA